MAQQSYIIIIDDNDDFPEPIEISDSSDDEDAVIVISDSDNDSSSALSQCTICLEPNKEYLITTPCQHMFHQRCLHRALLNRQSCPNCRYELDYAWRNQNRVGVQLTSAEYWDMVQHSLPAPLAPANGPLLPHSQREYNIIFGYAQHMPDWWSKEWVKDRMWEMRIRFNIPESFPLSPIDVRQCEENGRRGIYPEWSFPDWYMQ